MKEGGDSGIGKVKLSKTRQHKARLIKIKIHIFLLKAHFALILPPREPVTDVATPQRVPVNTINPFLVLVDFA